MIYLPEVIYKEEKMKNRIIILFILILILASFLFADEKNLKLNINSDEYIIENTGEKPNKIELLEDSSYISASELPKDFQFKTIYDEENGIVRLENEKYKIEFKKDSGVSIRLDTDVDLSQGYRVIDNNVYIPIRAIAKAMSYGVTWDGFNRTIYLLPNNQKKELSRYAKYNFTDEDILWLSRINWVEAKDGSVLKKIAVANVVLNRVRSDRFPNTIKEVIFQKGQFPPAYKKGFKTFTPPEESFEASRRAINGENNADECLFFNMVPFPSKSKEEFFGNIEGDYFYY